MITAGRWVAFVVCLAALLKTLTLVLAQPAVDCSSAQCVYLPGIQKAPTLGPTQTPDTSLVFAHRMRSHVNGTQYVLHGEIVNDLDVPIYVESVRIDFYDLNGHFIGTGMYPPWLHMINPHDVGPFSVPWPEYADVRVLPAWYEPVIVYKTHPHQGMYFYHVLLGRETRTVTSEYYEVTFRIKNTFNFTIDSLDVAYTFYASNGDVDHAGKSIYSGPLLPGQEADHTIRVMYAGTGMVPGTIIKNARAVGRMPITYLTATPVP